MNVEIITMHDVDIIEIKIEYYKNFLINLNCLNFETVRNDLKNKSRRKCRRRRGKIANGMVL